LLHQKRIIVPMMGPCWVTSHSNWSLS
jgi:hypothetical protein